MLKKWLVSSIYNLNYLDKFINYISWKLRHKYLFKFSDYSGRQAFLLSMYIFFNVKNLNK